MNRLDKTDLDFSKDFSKTAVIGATGLLGHYFLTAYRCIYPDCIGTSRKQKGFGILPFDLSRPDITSLNLSKTQHKDALILAGFSKISICENDKRRTRKINVEGTLELIRQLVSEGIKPIFVSSDYVFDGCKGDYSDNAVVGPVTEYGKQKAEVEARIGAVSNGNYLVVRLSKVFSLTKGDGSLFDEMASILVSGKTVRAAFDQIFCPTLIYDVIKSITALQVRRTAGIINICSPEKWSRIDLALKMAEVLEINPERVCRISLDELGVLPKRPKNTSMLITRLLNEINCSFTPILKCIKLVAKNWKK